MIPYCTDDADWAQGTYGELRDLPQAEMDPALHSSTGVSVKDFDIVKVIGRGSFGKVYPVKKK